MYNIFWTYNLFLRYKWVCDVQHFLDLCLFLRYKWVKIDQHPQFIFFILSLILMGYSLALQPMLKWMK